MYVTRKVFSAREEDLIKALGEKAFYEGYEQRMFDESREIADSESEMLNEAAENLCSKLFSVK